MPNWKVGREYEQKDPGYYVYDVDTGLVVFVFDEDEVPPTSENIEKLEQLLQAAPRIIEGGHPEPKTLPERIVTVADLTQALEYFGYKNAKVHLHADGMNVYLPEGKTSWSLIAGASIRERMPPEVKVTYYLHDGTVIPIPKPREGSEPPPTEPAPEVALYVPITSSDRPPALDNVNVRRLLVEIQRRVKERYEHTGRPPPTWPRVIEEQCKGLPVRIEHQPPNKVIAHIEDSKVEGAVGGASVVFTFTPIPRPYEGSEGPLPADAMPLG